MQVILVNDNSDDWEIVKEVERQLRWLFSQSISTVWIPHRESGTNLGQLPSL